MRPDKTFERRGLRGRSKHHNIAENWFFNNLPYPSAASTQMPNKPMARTSNYEANRKNFRTRKKLTRFFYPPLKLCETGAIAYAGRGFPADNTTHGD